MLIILERSVINERHDSLKEAKQYFLDKGYEYSGRGDWNRHYFTKNNGENMGYAWKNKIDGDFYETVEYI
jgi:hypothetical protein